jgi:hypothetical protein
MVLSPSARKIKNHITMKRILFIAGLLIALMTSCEKKDRVAVNSSSILGDWVISNRVWEYIEEGKVVDAEEEPVE